MNDAKRLLNQALYRLDSAREELNRPDEDVMTFAICHQVRNAMSDMMSAFLTMNGADATAAKTLEELRAMSVPFGDGFEKIELTSMVCHPGQIEGEKCFCMDLDRVRACLKIADDCRKIIENAGMSNQDKK